MKGKIKVMNERQDITNEELERFKNFDELLKSYHRVETTRKPWIKPTVIFAVAVLLIGASSYFWITSRETKITDGGSVPQLNKDIKPMDEVIVEVLPEEEKKQAPIEQTPMKAEKEVSRNEPQNKRKEQVITTTYQQAEPVDGYAKLYEYFNHELVYPSIAIPDSVQGVLTIMFTINREGYPENLEFTNSLGKAFEDEARRLIQRMPLWKPALLNGQPVPSRMSLPLTFELQKKSNIK